MTKPNVKAVPAVAVLLLAACGGSDDGAESMPQALLVTQPACFASVDGICTQVPSCDPNDPLCSCAGLVCRYVSRSSPRPAAAAPRQLVCECPVPGAVLIPAPSA